MSDHHHADGRFQPGTRATLTDGNTSWPVLINAVNLRPYGYVVYEVSWLTNLNDRKQLWVEACELTASEDSETKSVTWFHEVKA